MLSDLLDSISEGMEAALVVGNCLAYQRKIRRIDLQGPAIPQYRFRWLSMIEMESTEICQRQRYRGAVFQQSQDGLYRDVGSCP